MNENAKEQGAGIAQTALILQTLNKWLPKIVTVAPDKATAERAIMALGSMVRNNAALAKCTPNSILIAAYNIAKLGLNPDPQLGQVWVIPYKGVATVQVGYKGYISLVRNAGGMLEAAELIHENDDFSYRIDEKGTHLTWKPWYLVGKDDPGKIIGGFTILTTEVGTMARVVPFWELERRRKLSQAVRSNAKDSPWFVHPESMYLVATIRANAKLWALSTDSVQKAVTMDEAADEDRPQLGIDDAEFLELPVETAVQPAESGAISEPPKTAKPNGQKVPTAAKIEEILAIQTLEELQTAQDWWAENQSNYEAVPQKMIGGVLDKARARLTATAEESVLDPAPELPDEVKDFIATLPGFVTIGASTAACQKWIKEHPDLSDHWKGYVVEQVKVRQAELRAKK